MLRTLLSHPAWLTLPTLLAALAGCGGGGSADSGGSDAIPASGSYAWVLKSQGSTSNLRLGVSLVHPSTPAVEYVIEPASANVTGATLQSAGTVDAGGLRATSIKAQALLYIVGGDVRSLPMDANGSAAKGRVRRAQSTNACAFIIEAVDLAAPQNSRYIVSTAGSDGSCANATGRAELSFSAAGLPALTSLGPLSDGAPLGLVRHPSSLAPRAWIYPKKLVFWSPATTVTTRSESQAPFNTVVLSTHQAAVVDDGARLSVLEFSTDTAVKVTPLDSASTGGGRWQQIGFDADSYFVYRNSVERADGNWSVLKISRATAAVSQLASGSGLLSNAGMGNARLYATVIGVNDNRLLSIGKATGSGTQTLETTPSSTLSTVLTSVNTVHQLFRVTNIGSAAVNYVIEMIDETGAKLYSTNAGGFSMALADATTRNFNVSENRSRFIFVSGFGARGFADVALVSYDTSARAATALGSLPGVADFGQDIVFANVVSGPGNFMGGFSGRSNGGVIDAAGARVYSFDIGLANSLKLTSTQQ